MIEFSETKMLNGCNYMVTGFSVNPPPRELSPNARLHWAKLSKYKSEYRSDCGVQILSQLQKIKFDACNKVKIHYRWIIGKDCRACGYYAPRDEDNAIMSLKSLQDAMVDVGLFSNDNSKILKHDGIELIRDNKEYSQICVTLMYEYKIEEVARSNG